MHLDREGLNSDHDLFFMNIETGEVILKKKIGRRPRHYFRLYQLKDKTIVSTYPNEALTHFELYFWKNK